jgi:hypothetical protein
MGHCALLGKHPIYMTLCHLNSILIALKINHLHKQKD